MIEREHGLPLIRQAVLLALSRSSLYYEPQPLSAADLALMRRIDELHLELPFAGSRMLRDLLKGEGIEIGRKHVATLMRRMGIEAIYRRKNTSRRHPEHPVFPYLLRGLAVDRPNQVWAADITYIPMARGFLYLVAIIDWCTRKVLAWQLSNSLASDFCVAALEQAIARYGTPQIFNTDQGAQGDFRRSSQHLAIGGVAWDDQKVGLQNGQDVRRCTRPAGRVSISVKPSRRFGRALPRGLPARTQHWRAACHSRLARAGSARPVGWRQFAWLRSRDDSCHSASARSSRY